MQYETSSKNLIASVLVPVLGVPGGLSLKGGSHQAQGRRMT
jgi:hypothetical protein